jgi:hypothetical protein
VRKGNWRIRRGRKKNMKRKGNWRIRRGRKKNMKRKEREEGKLENQKRTEEQIMRKRKKIENGKDERGTNVEE